MKKSILLSTFTFFLFTFSFAQNFGWVDYRSKIPKFPNDTVYEGDYEAIASFTDVFFVDDNEGWITTWNLSNNNMDSSTILHTMDGGESWEVQIVPSNCNAIWMLNKNTGYAGSQDGRIYKTIDGGKNWLFHSIPAGPVRDISFPPNSETGYAVVDQSMYFFKIKPDTLERIRIPAPNFWTGVTSPAVDNVWFVGGPTTIFYDGDTTHYKSIPTCGYLQGIWFHDLNSGWASNLCYVSGYYEPTQHWIVIGVLPYTGADVCSVGEDHLWVVGFQGMMMNTHNASDFEHLPNGNSVVNVEWETPQHPLGETWFNAVYATSVNNVFVVGHKKAILKYTEISGIEDEVEHMKFEIYPNPAVSVISLQLPPKAFGVSRQSAIIEIYDLNGKKLLEKHIPAGTEEFALDVSSLQSGLYFCRLIVENKSVTKKLIIQK